MHTNDTASSGLHVHVVSLLAALAGGEPYGLSWSGQIPLAEIPVTPDAENANAVNAALSRFFTRVDNADAARLEVLGYRLPSLSCGDLIAWRTATYRVMSLGFEKLEPGAAIAAVLRRRRPEGPTVQVREQIARFTCENSEPQVLEAALIALARLCWETNTDPASVPELAELGLDDATLQRAFQ